MLCDILYIYINQLHIIQFKKSLHRTLLQAFLEQNIVTVLNENLLKC